MWFLYISRRPSPEAQPPTRRNTGSSILYIIHIHTIANIIEFKIYLIIHATRMMNYLATGIDKVHKPSFNVESSMRPLFW